MRPVDPRLLRRSGSVRAVLAVRAAEAVVAAGALLARAWWLGVAVAGAVAGRPLDELVPTLLGVAASFVVAAAVGVAGDAVTNRLAAAGTARLREDLVGGVLRHGHRLVPALHRGDVTALATRGMDATDAWWREFLPALAHVAVVPVAVLGFTWWHDPTTGAILTITLPLLPVFLALVGLAARRRTQQQWLLTRSLSRHLHDVGDALVELWRHRRAGRQVEVVAATAEQLRTTTLAQLRVAFLSALVTEGLAALSVAVVAVTVGLRLVTGVGDLDLLTAVAVLVAAPDAFAPVRAVGQRFHAAQEGGEVLAEVLDLLDRCDTAAATRQQGRRPAPDPARVGIDVQDLVVRFHGEERAALDEVDLSLPGPGLAVLVGASGSGKTTLLRALAGLVAPAAGAVVVGGVGLDDIDEAAWAARVVHVPQRPRPGALPLGAWLREGAPDADPTDVAAALDAVGATGVVQRLTDGLATPVGPGGRVLSGGEVRRLALARALLRARHGTTGLVLLDEPTADLDQVSATRVEDALVDLAGTHLVVVATHRPQLADRAHVAAVLSGGRVLEAGPAGRLAAGAGPLAAAIRAGAW